jgi:hypothetical protein
MNHRLRRYLAKITENMSPVYRDKVAFDME